MSDRFTDERGLIEGLSKGEDEAYRYAIKSYQGIMLYVATSIVGNAIAEEIVQDAWVSVIKSLSKFEGRSSLKTWILRIVSNTAKTRLRKESRSVAMGDALDLELAQGAQQDQFDESGHWVSPPTSWHFDTPEAILSSEELKEAISQAITQLPALQRSVLTLKEMEDLEMDEICKIL
ncbi:MAG: RNA polymerase sigma factor, partial [Gammaproteobacteria bacterium]|nr:RNA polymerase sigma factor [Gammaproteobacteria bacterium]